MPTTTGWVFVVFVTVIPVLRPQRLRCFLTSEKNPMRHRGLAAGGVRPQAAGL
jgi:hypothetical protein